jgi:hypothetical protein
MKNNKYDYGLIGNILISTIFVLYFYGAIIFSPNSFQFSEKGDAIKNYYTYAYYISNNTSYINFDGLNYPYGEHFLYTDCTPVLSVSLKTISSIYPGIGKYSVGIINFLLIISFIVSSFLIYLILKEFRVNVWLSSISAFLIMILAPQVFRLTGHLALGFGFFFPLCWYLFIKFEKSYYSIKYAVWLFLSLLFTFFIHAYLGMIAASFLFAFALVKFINQIRLKQIEYSYYFKLGLIIFIPIIIFRVFILFTDTHFGRTDNPWGFFFAHADANTVFLPLKRPFKPILEMIFGNINQKWEGWAYIGLSSLLSILFYLYLTIKKTSRQKKFGFDNKWFNNKHLHIAALAGILLLIFSTAYPFKLYKPSLDWVSVLKQFRAVGRFAWVFYFIITVSSVYFIDKFTGYLSAKGKKPIASIILFVFIGLFFVEALPYHTDTSKRISTSKNLFNKKNLDEDFEKLINNTDFSDYQAIIPLPFFYIGSENFVKTATDKIYLLTQLLSFHGNLPIMGSYLTRTSIWESKNIMQIMSPVYYRKEITKDILSDKPFLVIFSKQNISKYERAFLKRATVVEKNSEFEAYSITKDQLLKFNTENEINQYKTKKDGLFYRNGFLTNDTSSIFYFDSFDETKTDIKLDGNGSFTGLKKNYNTLAKFNPGYFKKDEDYIASFWMYNAGDNFGQDQLNSMFILQEKNIKTSKWSKIVNPMNSQVINGDWSLVEMEFKIEAPDDNIDFILKGDNYSKIRIYLDDFMIYKKGSSNYKIESNEMKNDSVLLINNQRISF